MKIRIYNPEKDSAMNIWVPTGILFSRLGMYFAAKAMTSQSRKDYEKKIEALWKSGDMDAMITPEDERAAEKLTPPITEQQAKELLTALRDSKYLLGGLPLVSLDTPEGFRLRIDL